MDRITLIHLFDMLQERYGDAWKTFEPETVSLDLGLEFSPVMYDKFKVLQLMVGNPQLYFQDVYFMAFATRVINDDDVDPGIFPEINSLELAFGLLVATSLCAKMGVVPEPTKAVREYAKHVLVHDGYGVPVTPAFTDLIGMDIWGEEHPRPAEDTQRAKAIKDYIGDKLK